MTSLLSQSHTPDEMCTSRRAGEPPRRGPCAAMRHSRRPPVSPTPPSHAGEPRCNSGPAPCPPGRGHPHLSREGARPPSLCFRALLVPHKALPLCSTCDLTATWWTNSLKLAPMSASLPRPLPSRGTAPRSLLRYSITVITVATTRLASGLMSVPPELSEGTSHVC